MRARWLWDRARNEHATPRQVALAAAMGAFVGCTPLLGVRAWVALGLATVLRLNRLFAYLGSRCPSNFVLTSFVTLLEIQLSHRIRTGEYVPFDAEGIAAHADTLLLDWCLGSIPVGLASALLVGLLGYGLARLRDLRRARKAAAEAEAGEAPAPVAEPPLDGEAREPASSETR